MADEILNTNIGDKVPEAPAAQLPELSADLVHANIIGCHVLKNRVDLRLLQWIFVLVRCLPPSVPPRGRWRKREAAQV